MEHDRNFSAVFFHIMYYKGEGENFRQNLRKGKKYKCVIIVTVIAVAAAFLIYCSVVPTIAVINVILVIRTGIGAEAAVIPAIRTGIGAEAAATPAIRTGIGTVAAVILVIAVASAILYRSRETFLTAVILVAAVDVLTLIMRRNTGYVTIPVVVRPAQTREAVRLAAVTPATDI